LIAALTELYLHWDDVKQVIASIWPTVQPYFEAFMNVITLGMYNVAKSIYDNWGTISPFLIKTMDKIFAYFGLSFNNFSKTVGDIFVAMKKTITDFVDWAAAPFAKLDRMLGGALLAVTGKKTGYDPTATTNQQTAAATTASDTTPLGTPASGGVESKYNNLANPQQQKLDIYMQVDHTGRPQKVTVTSPTNPVSFQADVGVMI
jgi:hypothetical protein